MRKAIESMEDIGFYQLPEILRKNTVFSTQVSKRGQVYADQIAMLRKQSIQAINSSLLRMIYISHIVNLDQFQTVEIPVQDEDGSLESSVSSDTERQRETTMRGTTMRGVTMRGATLLTPMKDQTVVSRGLS